MAKAFEIRYAIPEGSIVLIREEDARFTIMDGGSVVHKAPTLTAAKTYVAHRATAEWLRRQKDLALRLESLNHLLETSDIHGDFIENFRRTT